MKLLNLLAVSLISLAIMGCSTSPGPVSVQPPPVVEEIKMSLRDMAETGVKDSGLVIVGEQLENLRSADPAKAAEVEPHAKGLEAAQSPADVKKHAAAIIKILES